MREQRERWGEFREKKRKTQTSFLRSEGLPLRKSETLGPPARATASKAALFWWLVEGRGREIEGDVSAKEKRGRRREKNF